MGRRPCAQRGWTAVRSAVRLLLAGLLLCAETTPWSAQPFTDNSITTTTGGSALCSRSGPYFNQTPFEYIQGGVTWGWFFNNECYQTTSDTAEGLGCCGNAIWDRASPWTLYLWARRANLPWHRRASEVEQHRSVADLDGAGVDLEPAAADHVPLPHGAGPYDA